MKRWLVYVLMAVAGLALCACYPLFLEGVWVETTFTRIRLPQLQRPVRVLHLSDLHLGDHPSRAELERIAEDAVRHHPDFICLTGDYVDTPFVLDRDPLEGVIRRLSAKAPVYAILGNHDGGKWLAGRGYPFPTAERVAQELERGGAVVLHNRSATVEVRGQPLVLVGVSDLWSDDVDGRAAFAGVPAGRPVILLAHNPDSKDVLAPLYRWDLMLAGHTHGNQVNLPFYDEPWATVRDQRFLSGLHAWNGTQLYINRGLGGASGVRFRSRPEISILELVP